MEVYTLIRLISVLAIGLSCCSFSTGYDIVPPIPVESTTPGIRYNPNSTRPKVRLEIFIDLHCPDSRNQWGILKLVQDHYGNDKLDLILQQAPLPYHRNAFLATQGLYLIEASSVSSELFDYVEENLRLWSDYSTSNTVNLSENEVLDNLGDLAERVTGIDKNEFITNIGNYRSNARSAWKFAARRGVAVTPTFFLNGVELGIGVASPTFQDWIAYLDKIIV